MKVIERCQSIRWWARYLKANRGLNIDHHTLGRWLQVKYMFPNLPRGARVLIRESQIDAVLRERMAADHWTRHGARKAS